MTVIGLTGGIASGKSTAAEILREHGATIIDADRLGHRSYEPGTPGFEKVVNAFGHDIVGKDGFVDRRVLGGKVFGAPGQMERLNAIVWPEIRALIREEVDQIRAQDPGAIIVLEAAVLLEAGWQDLCDEIWVVTTPVPVAVERLKSRNNLAEDAAMARINAQMSNKERSDAADVKIENAGTEEQLRQKVERAWAALVERVRPARKAVKPAAKAAPARPAPRKAAAATKAAPARATAKAAPAKPKTTAKPKPAAKPAARTTKATAKPVAKKAAAKTSSRAVAKPAARTTKAAPKVAVKKAAAKKSAPAKPVKAAAARATTATSRRATARACSISSGSYGRHISGNRGPSASSFGPTSGLPGNRLMWSSMTIMSPQAYAGFIPPQAFDTMSTSAPRAFIARTGNVICW